MSGRRFVVSSEQMLDGFVDDLRLLWPDSTSMDLRLASISPPPQLWRIRLRAATVCQQSCSSARVVGNEMSRCRTFV
jgi:hypothetical protein